MIKFKYAKGWESKLDKRYNGSNGNQVVSTFHSLHSLATHIESTPPSITNFAKTLIQFIFNHLDADNTLLGLFRLIKFANKHRICPFLATSDYCLKILSADSNGKLTINASPIYQLGPEYPEYYEKQQGQALNQDAIIGLLDADCDNPEEPATFNLGIDAGVAFKDAPIPHNKILSLQIYIVDEGIVANVDCEKQTTSKVFSWDQLGMSSAAYADYYDHKAQNIWAA